MNYDFGTIQKIKGIQWNRNSPKELLQYAIGALLYAPADHNTIGEGICNCRYPDLKNIVFCLEDSILDKHVEKAEEALSKTIKTIDKAVREGKLEENNLPLIFIRIRNSEQMLRMVEMTKNETAIVTGFVIPKLDNKNRKQYEKAMIAINEKAIEESEEPPKNLKYFMPTIESFSVMDKQTRMKELYGIKETIDKVSDCILNVRIGGNDFCNLFGVRRKKNHTIYDIGVIRDVLTDIMNIFGRSYVVSAPVWEYFGDETDTSWSKGLKKELELDRLNGFIGKTVIHPSQIPVVQRAYMIEESDYEDALSILHWESKTLGVEKGKLSGRMNEMKVHERWALRIMALANLYGVKENEK